MAGNYFQGDKDHPRHVSVGAVVLNDQNEVCCHLLVTKDLSGYWANEISDEFFLLMRETVEPKESLESALHRGLLEEFGIKGEIIDYAGSIQSHWKHEGVEVEKTTLYFLVRFKSQNLAERETSTIEGTTQLVWKSIDELIPVMNEQGVRYDRTDVDESSILERVKNIRSL